VAVTRFSKPRTCSPNQARDKTRGHEREPNSGGLPQPDPVPGHRRRRGSHRVLRLGVRTFVTGDRIASIVDPFGQRWAVMTRVEDVDAAERDRRLAEWAREHV
jgi:hypothetical protein